MSDLACPECGGPVDSYLTCHTYSRRESPCYSSTPGHTFKWNFDLGVEWCLTCDKEVEYTKTTWMSCMPCDSATKYYCIGHSDEHCSPRCWEYEDHDGCGWDWTKGLNPGNPRSAENDLKDPHWNE